MAEADRSEQLLGALLPRDSVGARSGERRHENVLEHRALRQQVMELEDESDRFIAKLRETSLIEFAKILPSDAHLARVGAIECANNIQQRALPATGRAEDSHRLAGFDLQPEVVQDFDGIGTIGRAVGFREVRTSTSID
jgi:hypothetical protein